MHFVSRKLASVGVAAGEDIHAVSLLSTPAVQPPAAKINMSAVPWVTDQGQQKVMHSTRRAHCSMSHRAPTAEWLDRQPQHEKKAFLDVAAASCPQQGPFTVVACCSPSLH